MLGSPVDIALVAGIVLIVFGPKKMPELGKALGQGIGNFKKALHETGEEVKEAAKAAQEEPKPAPQPAGAVASGSADSGSQAQKEEAAPPA